MGAALLHFVPQANGLFAITPPHAPLETALHKAFSGVTATIPSPIPNIDLRLICKERNTLRKKQIK
jgi:hypothetical protein